MGHTYTLVSIKDARPTGRARHEREITSLWPLIVAELRVSKAQCHEAQHSHRNPPPFPQQETANEHKRAQHLKTRDERHPPRNASHPNNKPASTSPNRSRLGPYVTQPPTGQPPNHLAQQRLHIRCYPSHPLLCCAVLCCAV